jgi:CRP-like cAMP-binding protein
MRSRITLPSEVVIHQGDISEALYFIRSGKAEVLKIEGPMGLPSEDFEDDRVVAVLKEHACFGEQSFMTQSPALATVRSVGYCTLMRIFKADFDRVVAMFPALRVHMLGVQREQLQEYSMAKFQRGRARGSLWGVALSGSRAMQRFKAMRASIKPAVAGPDGTILKRLSGRASAASPPPA